MKRAQFWHRHIFYLNFIYLTTGIGLAIITLAIEYWYYKYRKPTPDDTRITAGGGDVTMVSFAGFSAASSRGDVTMVSFAGFSVASSRGDVTMVSFAGFSAASSRGDVTMMSFAGFSVARSRGEVARVSFAGFFCG